MESVGNGKEECMARCLMENSRFQAILDMNGKYTDWLGYLLMAGLYRGEHISVIPVATVFVAIPSIFMLAMLIQIILTLLCMVLVD